MTEWVDIPIGTKCYRPRSGTQSIERLINLYAEPSEAGAKTAATVLGTPGLTLWSTAGDGPIRGLHRALGCVWVASGTAIYALNETSKTVEKEWDLPGSGPVRMVSDATHVVVCTDSNAYAMNLSAYVALPESNLIGAAYQDGYGLYVQRDTQNFWLSDLDDLSDIPALNFTTADAKPDNVVAIISDQRQVWVFKENTIEIYANTGNATFTFERQAFIERGCRSPGSVAAADSRVFWLGDDLRVYAAAGYEPQWISTPAIDRLIADATGQNAAEAFAYAQGGHTFYVLTFADLTLAYDTGTGLWHERRSFGLDRWRVSGYCKARDRHLVGDYENGNIYELDLEAFDEEGDVLERIMVMPPLSTDPLSIITHELFIDMEVGVGLVSGQGIAPVVMLASSDDDGSTWGDDVEASIGALGDKRRRVKFNRLGRSQNRSYRLTITDPVKVAILGARARLEVLAQ